MQKITTQGCHGKVYPVWFWPCLLSLDHNNELCLTFLRNIRQQLLVNFKHHKMTWRQLSNSTMGSGGPEWIWTEKEEDELIDG